MKKIKIVKHRVNVGTWPCATHTDE